MPDKLLLEKYAKLIVEVGANVQKDQPVVINGTTESVELIRAISKAAYKAGAKRVMPNIIDDYVSHDTITYASVETLTDIPDYTIERFKNYIETNVCLISITSPIPGLNADLDPKKLQQQAMAMGQKMAFFRAHTMGNKTQWVVAASPNLIWAEAVFPDLKGTEALESLWSSIFAACRVDEKSDPVKNWHKHNERLAKYNQLLNEYQFKYLYFKNSAGTDCTIELVKNHVWAGGSEKSAKGVIFNPNIPTEEAFTMPSKLGTNGKIVATLPLNYQGKLIKDFWLEFEDGKVVDFDAKEEKATLEALLNFDAGSRYLGEIALIGHDTPISNMNLVFLNTLLDENASCHVALGRAYPMNIKGGTAMTEAELEKLGYNNSMVHVDFMFGSPDMSITGIKEDGTKIAVFENGNFVI